MKSFNQFLQESYLSEEPAGRERSPKEQAVWDEINKKEAAAAERKANRKPSGAAADPSKQFKPQAKTTKVASPARKSSGAAADPWKQFPKKPQQQLGMPKTGPSSSLPGRTLAPSGGTTAKPALPAAGQTQKGGALVKTKPAVLSTTPPIEAVKVTDVTKSKGKLPSGTKPPTLAKTANPKSLSAVKPSSTTGKFPSGLGRNLGRAAYGLEAGLETLDQKSRGRKTGSAIAMGATKAAGGWAGAKAGAAGGAALGSLAGPIGTGVGAALGGIGGYVAGSNLAGKASETVAGATGKEKAAMAQANRQRQAGSALKGIGGKTTFDNKKGTMTTGVGPQRKTVKLANTSVVTGPGGKQEVGNLAYKNGQAVYKRSDTKSLAQTSSNPLERIGRSLFAGAYKQSDAANAAKKLNTARQKDDNRQKALGVKLKPGG